MLSYRCIMGIIALSFMCAAGIAGGQGTALGVSDAIVLIQPQGAAVSLTVVYPEVVSHKRARARIVGLCRMAGWSLASIGVTDSSVQTNADFGRQKELVRGTDTVAVLVNAPQVQQGGFLLQPYVDAFADLGRIEIVYMVPPDTGFRGLRHFSDARVSVQLVREGGPYRYRVDYRGSGPVPRLPVTQAPEIAREGPVAAPSTGTPPSRNPAGLLIAIAGAAGIAAFALMRLWARPRAQRPGGQAAGRVPGR